MVIVFDLDDTLYNEISFVQSGYRAVARYLASLLAMTPFQIEAELVLEFNKQRAGVFNRFLEKQGLCTQRLVTRCLSIYRSHHPMIHLFPEAKACLERFRDFPLYVLTDGNQRVQRGKFYALGLDSWIRKCVCTYAYGIHHTKPSPYCFKRICKWEKAEPANVVYIADNPHKDFVGIKPLGFRTIRVLTGPYRDLAVDPRAEAEWVIKDLNALNLDSLLRFMENI